MAPAAKSFVVVFPTLPVIPTTTAPSRRAAPGRHVDQRLGGVRHLDRRDVASTAPDACDASVAAAPATGRLADELVSVSIGDERHEEIPWRRASGCRTRRRRCRRHRRPAGHRSPRRRRTPGTSRTEPYRAPPSGSGGRRRQYRCGGEPGPSRRAVWRPVRRARRQLCHRGPRAGRDRPGEVPSHADRHLDDR